MITLISYCILIHLWNIFVTIMGEDYCYMRDNHSYKNFATKTAYENVHGEGIHIIPDCKVIYIWALMRHGTRYGPSEKHQGSMNISIIRDQIIENHEIYKRGKLCKDDLQNLKNWTDQWRDKIPTELTPQGVKDMKGIASRLKTKFGHHFDFLVDELEIQTTSKRRCQQSSMAFTNELFNTSYADLVGNNITVNDEFLRVMEELVPVHREQRKFLSSKHIQKVIDNVSSRLGYESPVSFEFVEDLYSYCTYESAWFVHSKPGFCASFTIEDLKILEYKGDLHYYYGYGNENQTAKRLACPIVQDLLAKITFASNCPEKDLPKNGVFYFGHSETLQPTIAQLGLFNVERPFLHDNYELQSERSWRSSSICPFAANIMAVLYKCPDGFKIVFYNNEKIVKFPTCEDKICPLQKFQEYLSQKILNDCSQNSSARGILAGPAFIIVWILVLSMQLLNKTT